jgi:hypothetical protein
MYIAILETGIIALKKYNIDKNAMRRKTLRLIKITLNKKMKGQIQNCTLEFFKKTTFIIIRQREEL